MVQLQHMLGKQTRSQMSDYFLVHCNDTNRQLYLSSHHVV